MLFTADYFSRRSGLCGGTSALRCSGYARAAKGGGAHDRRPCRHLAHEVSQHEQYRRMPGSHPAGHGMFWFYSKRSANRRSSRSIPGRSIQSPQPGASSTGSSEGPPPQYSRSAHRGRPGFPYRQNARSALTTDHDQARADSRRSADLACCTPPVRAPPSPSVDHVLGWRGRRALVPHPGGESSGS